MWPHIKLWIVFLSHAHWALLERVYTKSQLADFHHQGNPARFPPQGQDLVSSHQSSVSVIITRTSEASRSQLVSDHRDGVFRGQRSCMNLKLLEMLLFPLAFIWPWSPSPNFVYTASAFGSPNLLAFCSCLCEMLMCRLDMGQCTLVSKTLRNFTYKVTQDSLYFVGRWRQVKSQGVVHNLND